MSNIDLHIHSTYSDGTLTPAEIVALARETGLGAISVTDHDEIGGIAEAKAAAAGTGVEVVSGAEFSGEHNGVQFHILGYLFDENCETIKTAARLYAKLREQRNLEMISLLNAAGLNVTKADMLEYAPLPNISRAHFALILVKKGYAADTDAAFAKFLSPPAKTFAPFRGKTAEQAIAAIKDSGGAPVLAHPHLYGLDGSAVEKYVKIFKEMGMIGIECFYPRNEHMAAEILRLARKYDLRPTGGSDFHGSNRKRTALGCVSVAPELLDGLKKAISEK